MVFTKTKMARGAKCSSHSLRVPSSHYRGRTFFHSRECKPAHSSIVVISLSQWRRQGSGLGVKNTPKIILFFICSSQLVGWGTAMSVLVNCTVHWLLHAEMGERPSPPKIIPGYTTGKYKAFLCLQFHERCIWSCPFRRLHILTELPQQLPFTFQL